MSSLTHPKVQEAALSQNGVATSSTAPPPYESLSSKFAIVSLNMMDRIRLIQFSSTDIDRILEVIHATWEQGVQNTRPYNASFEIQLKGHPWIHNLHGNMKSRRLVRALLQALHELGWVYDASVSLCKKPDEKDTLIFRKTTHPRPLHDWFSISFDQWHTLTVQDGPADICKQLAQRFSSNGWTKESTFLNDRMEIRLNEMYWVSRKENCVQVRLILLTIIETLEESGFSLYASLTAANRAGAGAESDMLVCARKRNLDPVTTTENGHAVELDVGELSSDPRCL